MDKSKERNLTVRWTAMLMIGIAASWAICCLVTGRMPIANEIRLTEDVVWTLPFGIPRIFDCL